MTAASLDGCGIGGGQDASGKVTITISGSASVNAQTRNPPAAIGSDRSSATVNIEDNADVTAVGSGVAIGTGYSEGTSTVINITGGTVNAVTRDESRPAIGTVNGNLDLTINSSTGKTTVNTYTTSSDPLSLNIGTGHYDSSAHKYRTSPSEGAEYNEDGSSNLGESNAAVINFYRNTTLGTGTYNAPKTLDDSAFHATYEFQGTTYNAKYTLSDKDKGDLYKVVHNRKYMKEHPEIVDDFNKLENSDLHDWQLVGEVVEPTLEKDGYADYICRIDKCGQTRHVVLPKLTPEEMREVGVIFWDAAAQAAPAALQGKVLSADEQTATAEKSTGRVSAGRQGKLEAGGGRGRFEDPPQLRVRLCHKAAALVEDGLFQRVAGKTAVAGGAAVQRLTALVVAQKREGAALGKAVALALCQHVGDVQQLVCRVVRELDLVGGSGWQGRCWQ